MNTKRLILINALMFLIIAAVSITGYSYYIDAKTFIQTEDAKVSGDLISITSEVAGKLTEWPVAEGKKVKKGDLLGKVTMGDQTIDMIAPIAGTIVQNKGNIGQLVNAGQPLAQIVDMNKLYVVANIEETVIREVRVDQEVDVKIDWNSESKLTGNIKEVGLTTNSVFTLLPPEHSSGSYTKVVQRIPVKIELDSYPEGTIPGMNATIWIRK